METLIVHPDSNDKLKALKAVMQAMKINFEVETKEQREDRILYAAMEEGRKTPLLNDTESASFLSSLKSAK